MFREISKMMKNIKMIYAKRLALIICFGMILTACAGVEQKEDEAQPQEEEKIQIGMSFDSFVIERWQRDRDVFVSTAKELGAEVYLTSDGTVTCLCDGSAVKMSIAP